MKAKVTNGGLIFEVTEEVELFYDKEAKKIKLFKNKQIVNEIQIDPTTYTISDLMIYLEKLEL